MMFQPVTYSVVILKDSIMQESSMAALLPRIAPLILFQENKCLNSWLMLLAFNCKRKASWVRELGVIHRGHWDSERESRRVGESENVVARHCGALRSNPKQSLLALGFYYHSNLLIPRFFPSQYQLTPSSFSVFSVV